MPIALRVSIARLMTIARDQVSRADPPTVTVIQQAVPTLVTGRDLLDRLQLMIRSKVGSALEDWIRVAAGSLLASFAKGDHCRPACRHRRDR
jgi:hypothetical protein